MALYHIAGVVVEMTPRFSLLADRAAPYAVDSGTPQIAVAPCGDEAFEEYAETAVTLYTAMAAFDAFFLHSSAVELDGKAYLFCAPSGTGKSTHARFWRQELGATVINDDKPLLRLIDGTFYACGTPFSGKDDLSRNVCIPLGGIAMLSRAEHTAVEPLIPSKALWYVLNQTLRPEEAAAYERLLTLAERLVTTVPFYHIGCTNDPSAAHIAKQAMK